MTITELREAIHRRVEKYDSVQDEGWYLSKSIATTISDLLYANNELLHKKVANYEDLRREMQSTFYPEKKPSDDQSPSNDQSPPKCSPPFDVVYLGQLFHALLDELETISE